MSTYAQFYQIGPLYYGGQVLTNANLYHYVAGTTTDKDIWSDRAKTITLEQPYVNDSTGVWSFFADGLYKFIVTDENSVTLFTWDNFLIEDFTNTSLTEGTAIVSASTVAVGPEVWAHIIGSTTIANFSGTIPFFWAVFDGSLTLTNSSALKLPGSVDITVQAGDVLFFLNEGSNVFRLAGQMPNSFLINRTSVTAKMTDARTNTTATPITSIATTTSTPAAGIGTQHLFRAQSQGANPADVAAVGGVFKTVTATLEDSYVMLQTRNGGAALSPSYYFYRSSGNSSVILSHSNSTQRTVTLLDGDFTVVGEGLSQTLTNKTLTSPTVTGNTIGTGAVKTSTGSSTFANVDGTLTTNDYAFAPAWGFSSGGAAGVALQVPNAADPNNTVGRVAIVGNSGTGNTVIARWRYITASDDGTIWIAKDNVTGAIVATWASDDPTPNDLPGIMVVGCTSLKLKSSDLEQFTILNEKASEAEAFIKEKNLNMENQAWRALQIVANDQAPSAWLLQNLEVKDNQMTMKAPLS